jgi:ADP-ribose pyrophosphatase YjhB (NUDIX family)
MGFNIHYQYCPQCRRPLSPTAEGDPHCAHCDITIYKSVASAGCVFPVRDGKVLLARRAREPYKGDYDLVGGFMKSGETPAQAAVREAKEETGLDLKITGFLGAYPDHYGPDGPPVLGLVHIGELAEGAAHAADDVSQLEWFDINHIPERAFQSGFSSVVAALRDLQAWHRS